MSIHVLVGRGPDMVQRLGWDTVLFQEVVEVVFKVLVEHHDMVTLLGKKVLGSQMVVEHKGIFFHLFSPSFDHVIEKAHVVGQLPVLVLADKTVDGVPDNTEFFGVHVQRLNEFVVVPKVAGTFLLKIVGNLVHHGGKVGFFTHPLALGVGFEERPTCGFGDVDQFEAHYFFFVLYSFQDKKNIYFVFRKWKTILQTSITTMKKRAMTYKEKMVVE